MKPRILVAALVAAPLLVVAASAGADEPPPDDTPPDVSITSPKDGASFPAGTATVTVDVEADDRDSGVTRVRLFIDGKEIATDESKPWQFESVAIEPGDHELTAEADNYDGAKGKSSAVEISVEAATAPEAEPEAKDAPSEDTPAAAKSEDAPKVAEAKAAEAKADEPEAKDGCFASARPRSLAGSGIALLFALFAGLMLRRRK